MLIYVLNCLASLQKLAECIADILQRAMAMHAVTVSKDTSVKCQAFDIYCVSVVTGSLNGLC